MRTHNPMPGTRTRSWARFSEDPAYREVPPVRDRRPPLLTCERAVGIVHRGRRRCAPLIVAVLDGLAAWSRGGRCCRPDRGSPGAPARVSGGPSRSWVPSNWRSGTARNAGRRRGLKSPAASMTSLRRTARRTSKRARRALAPAQTSRRCSAPCAHRSTHRRRVAVRGGRGCTSPGSVAGSDVQAEIGCG
jgi:hypothetical protein